MKDTFIMYNKYKEVFDSLTDEQAGQLIKGIFNYTSTGESGLSGLMTAIFTPIKQDLDRNNANYEAKCEINRINGAKGGRPKKETQKTQSVILKTQENPKKHDNDNDNEYDNESIFNNSAIQVKREKETVADYIGTYSRECFKLPQIKIVTDSRKKAIGLFKKTYTLKDWEEVCKIANNCDFLLRCKR